MRNRSDFPKKGTHFIRNKFRSESHVCLILKCIISYSYKQISDLQHSVDSTFTLDSLDDACVINGQ